MSENIFVEEKDLYVDKKAFLEIINNQYENDNIYVGISELGLCVKAKRNIKIGEIIYVFTGPTISFSVTKERGVQECMSLQYDFDKYVDTEAPGMYVNHSCDPNSGIQQNFNLVALKNILIHEEIRFDYSTTMDENSYTMECKCGKPVCRGLVTDFKLLPDLVKKNYIDLDVVSDFIKKQYQNL